jgi:tetratricopeptide (TPR) repeat protein
LFEFDTDLKGEEKEQANKIKLPCYLNIAACKVKQGLWKDVIENAGKAIDIDSNNTKALFRRGLAYLELDEWNKSHKDFSKAMELDQNNKELRREYQRLKQRMNEQDQKDKEMFAKMFNRVQM